MINFLKQHCRSLYSQTLGKRRLAALTKIIQPVLPEKGSILDIGCGDGSLAASLQSMSPKLIFHGVELLARGQCAIPVTSYEGGRLPFEDKSFDYAMLITVLHHTDDYRPLLQEAIRVSRSGIILLDHQVITRFDRLMLCVIDWPGNVPFGVYTPYNFISQEAWSELFSELHLCVEQYDDRIYLFGRFFDFLFGRNMHFVTRVKHKSHESS